nr:hypothetical protein [Tanacetum cinerariifolium]
MVLVDHTGWKLRCRHWTGTTEQLIKELESTYDNAPNMFSIRIHHGGKFLSYPGRMYVSGRVDIFDMVDIDLFTVVAPNKMVLKLGYTGESEPMFYNYLRPLTSLDVGLYALACEDDVRCLATLVRSFKLIELSGAHEVDTQSHVLPTIQSQFSDINLSFVSQQATASRVIDDVMRQLSFDETEFDGEAGFVDVVGSGVDSSGLSHDESFVVDDLDLNLNEPRLALKNPLWQRLALKNQLWQRSAPRHPLWKRTDTEYDDQSSKDVGTDDDDVDEDFLVDEENKIVEPDVDVCLFGISMDLPFDNIGIPNIVLDDVLEGEDVNVINADGFNSDSGNDEERNYKRSPKEAKDRVYLHFIESRRNLKLYKNDIVKIRARCEGKVLVFTMSQGTGPTGPYSGMEAGHSGSSGPTNRSKKRKNTVKAVQDQLQCELEVQISMSKAFRVKAKAEREIRGDYVLQYYILKDYVVELQSTNPNTTVKIAVERNNDPSLPTRCLDDDIDMHLNSNFTFISDRQRGIILAIKTVYPSAEHRYCLRHIHENMKQGWCGQAYKDLLWRAASATNVRDLEKCRDKPVITLLEYIRENCMKRFVNVQGVIDKYIGPLTLTATRITESIKKEAHLMKVQWNGANKYQVSGIPCKHVVAACWNMALNDPATPPQKLRKGRTITCQSCGKIGHNKATYKGQGLSVAAGEGGAGDPGGAGVASQGSSHTRWTTRRVQTEIISPQKRTPTQP